jgi:predicted phage-related endonuclease
VQILECKTAGIHGARLWRDGVPEYVQLQVMHQLAVTGHRAADVAVLVGGQELRIFRIERDEALIARLIEMEQAVLANGPKQNSAAGDGSDSAKRLCVASIPR